MQKTSVPHPLTFSKCKTCLFQSVYSWSIFKTFCSNLLTLGGSVKIFCSIPLTIGKVSNPFFSIC